MEPGTKKLTGPSHRTSRRGVALVIVLGFLVLITVVVVAFLSSVTTEYSTATSAAAGATGKELADSSVQLVIGQIRQATAQGPNVAWASQPGMIRTYGSGTPGSYTASSAPLAYYKLYSSDNMVVASSVVGSFSPLNDVPADWSSRPAQFTDLNAPVTDAANTKNYPILDPGSLNPATGVSTSVAGFSITSAPTTGTTNTAPMPVKWIYVLRDGTLTAPMDATSTSGMADFTGATAGKKPTTDNPIVGRMAFWTDDETCKVNINTASEGTYWDIPRANVVAEQNLGSYQPAQHEWQRYPGHPATTCLSTVFPSLSAQKIYELTPRVNGGGSNAGNDIPSGALTADRDRLYASVDELIFDPIHAGTNSAGLTKVEVEQARFFLTAHSRAPEVNLFGKPRIACWPIYRGLAPDYLTAFDKLIAFCSTINGQPYYFQRENSASPTNDIGIARNAQLYSYLQSLTSTSTPGFGGDFSTKYAGDRDQILTEIFDYIRSTNLQDDNLAVANQFTPPSGTGSGWVIPSSPTTGLAAGTMGFGRAFTLSELAIGFICNAAADDPATPLPIDESAGSNTTANPMIGPAGPVLNTGEIMVQAVVVPDFFSVMQGWHGMVANLRLTVSGLSNLKLNGAALYSPATDTATVDYQNGAGGMLEGRGWGGVGGWSFFAFGQSTTAFPLVSNPIRITPGAPSRTMDFSGGQITVTLSSLAGTKPIYQTFVLNLPAAHLLPAPKIAATGTNPPTQTEKEQWWTFRDIGSIHGRVGNAGDWPGKPGSRLAGAFFREDYDVVRGVVLKHGDFRIVAGQQTIADPTNVLFKPLPNYQTLDAISCQLSIANQGEELVANLGAVRDPNRQYFLGVTAPNYVNYAYIYPSAPGGDRPEATGDFDTGLAAVMDSAYINKPDEGNANFGPTKIGADAPYFYGFWYDRPAGATYFSPNRMMPSSGMFGSLPTRIAHGTPWRTLLFRPQGSDFPTSAGTGLLRHPASLTGPPDHLFMDLFWMPVVEPYAISEPFSTAGKVNLNYQTVPFTYIERSTALRAVFKAEKLGVVLNTDIGGYKSGSASVEIRKEIDVNNPASATKKDTQIETLNQFTQKFLAGGLFKSASEICDLHIVPTGKTAAGMPAFWNTAQLTGDNLRERIYTTLYPRLTTKSNSFTVHFRVQVLKKVPGTDVAQWVESKDKVASEYRGSSLIERYIDPSDPNLPDFAMDPAASLDTNYKFRVVSTKKFTVK